MYNSMYSFTGIPFSTSCNTSALIIIGKIYKNAIHNIGQGFAIFRLFVQNELVM